MNPSAAPAAFEGVSGSITVSITAFTIVFAVLAGLTAVIYAIKIFAGEDVRNVLISNGNASLILNALPSLPQNLMNRN